MSKLVSLVRRVLRMCVRSLEDPGAVHYGLAGEPLPPDSNR